MNARERVATILAGGVPDRVPWDAGYWTTTVERWWREGLPMGGTAGAFFDTEDIVRIAGDWSLQLPERVEQASSHLRTYWDDNGALRRDLHTEDGWTSQWLDYSIKTRDDWHRYRPQMAFNESRIPSSALETWHKARAEGKAIFYQAHACFHPTWTRIGMVNEMVLMLDDSEWMQEMYAAQVQLIIAIFEGMLRRGMTFDAAFMADDLGYVAAPLISPALYRELVFPHHKRLCDYFAERGLKTLLHSDGNVGPLIPDFLDAGFAGLNPLEAKAGLDVRALKPQYGSRLTLYGNIDVRKLAGSKDEIEEEIASKFSVAKEGGGYIYSPDHSVPNDVSFENYCFAMEMVRRHSSYD